VVGAGLVTVADVAGAGCARPPPVAVEDDAHVTGSRAGREVAGQPALVDAVDELADAHVRKSNRRLPNRSAIE
jgi:hypothetical protein